MKKGYTSTQGTEFIKRIEKYIPDLTNAQELKILKYATVTKIHIDENKFSSLPQDMFTARQIDDLKMLTGKKFRHTWELEQTLTELNNEWEPLPSTLLNKKQNAVVRKRFQVIENTFKWETFVL